MLRKEFDIEICAGNLQSAINAAKAGADRVEFCDNLGEAGTTPSLGSILTAKKHAKIDLFVLLRPRGGDFIYSDEEFESILIDLEAAKNAGADGIVSGFLNKDGEIDLVRTKKFIDAAEGLPFTFHRAFDLVVNPIGSLKLLEDLGVKRVLTSGQKQTAAEGKELIAQMIEIAKDIKIMPGSGINEQNIAELAHFTGASSFHTSLGSLLESKSNYENPAIEFNTINNIPGSGYKATEIKRVKNLIKKLENLSKK